MCFSSPDIKDPQPAQEAQAPDYADISKQRKKATANPSGTLLTGPSGVSLQSTQSFAGSSLLGQ